MACAGTDPRLDAARGLLAALEAGDEDGARTALSDLDVLAQSALYQAVGSATRALHDELVACASDPALARLAQTDAPDVRVRLDQVITLTDAAAHRTLDAVERARPRAQALRAAAARLGTDSGALQQVGAAMEADALEVDAALAEILLAQDFQDLTGQLIRRSIALVEGVEQRLLALLTVAGVPRLHASGGPGPSSGAGTASGGAPRTGSGSAPGTANGFGPRVAGTGDVALGSQQEVDDLLESLGF